MCFVRESQHLNTLPWKDVAPSALELYYTKIKPAVNRAIMPTVQTPSGEWIQVNPF